MGREEADDQDLELDELFRLILAEVRETNDKLSEIQSEIESRLSSFDDARLSGDDSGGEIVSAIKSVGSFTIILLGLILWKLW